MLRITPSLLLLGSLTSGACAPVDAEPSSPVEPGDPRSPMQPDPSLPVVSGVVFEAGDAETELECVSTNECVQPYLDFLAHPEVLEAAPPLDGCDALVDDWIAAALEDRSLGEPPFATDPHQTLGETILQTTRMGFLFDPESLWTRPLRVVERSRRTEWSDTGAPYELRELLLVDPLVGQVQVQHLLPLDSSGAVPTVVVLPGHQEDADTHRLQRFGQYLPENGLAAVIVSFRAWDQRADADATRAMLCSGMSMMLLRGYEAMLAVKLALTAPESRGQPIGFLGHSGGSMIGNLLAWLDVNPARVHVSDLVGDYRSAGPADDGLPAVDCATHPGLSPLSHSVNDLREATRPVLEVPYGYALDGSDDSDPVGDDPAPTAHFVPVFRAYLMIPPGA